MVRAKQIGKLSCIEKEIKNVLNFGFFLHNYFHYYTNSRIYSIAYNYFLEI
jgi:hypothetical protein